MRIGEKLVMDGLITNDTLAKALERQIIFGGRLGTNLVEMGALSEETLAKFLGKAFGVPYAGPEQFANVAHDVIDAFPVDLASKYTSFAFNKERSRLHVAMKDPNDYGALDELRFITGMDIRPYIASEIRIVFALEKYYGIKRDLRYINVTDESFDKPAKSGPAPGPKVVEPPKPAEPEEFLGDESQTDDFGSGFTAVEMMDQQTVQQAQYQQPQAPQYQQPQPQQQYQAPTQPQAQQYRQPQQYQTPPQPQAPQYQAPPQQPQYQASPRPQAQQYRPPSSQESAPEGQQKSLKDYYRALSLPLDRDHIAEAVVGAASADLGRVVLFLVKGSVMTGWKAAGGGLTHDAAASISITMDGPSIFTDVVAGKSSYKGPVLRVPNNNFLMDALGGVYPPEAVAYPLIIKGKVVGVLYGDSGGDSLISGDVARVSELMGKASMSLEILILRNKIIGE